MHINQLRESLEDKIKKLQPDSMIPVYHGTSIDTAIEFAEEGIDGRTRVARKYPHYIGGEMINRGLFVTTNFFTATTFGQIIIRFSARGKDLYYHFPAPETIKQIRADTAKKYPESFRPEVSDSLLDKSPEPQALFRGLVSPKTIYSFYLVAYDSTGDYIGGRYGEYQEEYSRSEFIDWFYNAYQKRKGVHSKRVPSEPLTEPQEKLSLGEFLDRIKERFNIDSEEILDLIKRAIEGSKTYEQQIHNLSHFPGGKIISYSVAKHLLPQILRVTDIEKAPNIRNVERYYT
jgi:hypothetical protein